MSNVTLENKAVDDNIGTAKLYVCNSNHGMHRLYPSKWCGESIPVLTTSIDDFYAFRGIERLDFVKIDVEGYELNVLHGMGITITKHLPKMLIEFHPATIREKGDDPYEIYRFLKHVGYKISLAPSTESITFDELYKKTNDNEGGQNIFCSPTIFHLPKY
jgi:hypothetical protein